jgi:hypothetical protein
MKYRSLWVIAAGLLFNALVIGSFSAYIAHLKRVAPTSSVIRGADFDSDDSKKRIAKLDIRTNGIFLLLAICMGALVYIVLHFIGNLRAMALPPALMSFSISSAFFGLLALFSGVGMAIATTAPTMRRWWPEDVDWYSSYLSVKRYGCDYERLCRGLGMVLVALMLILLPFGLNSYVQARDGVLAVHPFFGFYEKTFIYSDIQSIEDAPRATRYGYRWHYVVSFKDGQAWDSDDLPSGGRYESTKLVELLANKSGVAIKREQVN